MKAAYGYDRLAESKKGWVFCDPAEDLTVQQFKDAADINDLVARMMRGEEVKEFPVGKYGDFSQVPTFQEACGLVAQARFDFEQLPSATRKYFDNDAALLVDFLRSPANLEEAVRLGLVKRGVQREAENGSRENRGSGTRGGGEEHEPRRGDGGEESGSPEGESRGHRRAVKRRAERAEGADEVE